MTKPSNLIYGLQDKPCLTFSIFMGLQHACMVAIGFVLPVLLVRSVGGSPETAAHLVGMSMIAGGIGVIVQILHKGPIGSGYLCPQLCGPSFLSASLLAVKTGGLSLLFGMTCIAGIFEALFSRILHKLRVLFPAEVLGLIVAMVGMTVISLCYKCAFGLYSAGDSLNFLDTTVSMTTLAVMVGLNIWSKGKLKLFCTMIGIIFGYILSEILGVLTLDQWLRVAHAPLVDIPFAHHPGWSFSLDLIPPFLIAMLCSSLKTVGDLTTCQKINDSDWVRPDMKNIGKGVLADATGCFCAGILGGMGQSSSSSNIGLSIATGTTSRKIGYTLGIILIIFGLFPKLGLVFAIMPRPVIGATLIFAVSFMIVAGLQIIMSRMMDSRKIFVIGISLILGLGVDMMPATFLELPHWLQPVFSSSLSVATICAIILNLIMRIGISKQAVIDLSFGSNTWKRLQDFLDKNGKAWGARPEIINKVQVGTFEALEFLYIEQKITDAVTLTLIFDELKIIALLEYDGELVELQAQKEQNTVFEKDSTKHLTFKLLSHYTDDIKVELYNKRPCLRLTFEH